MLMKEQCFICTKNLSKINSILDAQYVKYSWRPHFEENKYILYFSKQNLYTCIPCGKQFFMWNLSKNKVKVNLISYVDDTNIIITYQGEQTSSSLMAADAANAIKMWEALLQLSGG